MALLRFFGATMFVLVVVGALALYVLANHSTTELTLTCTGTWVSGAEGVQGRPESVVAVIEEYRPWVFWTESDGNVRVESRDIALAAYFNFLQRVGDAPLVNYIFSRDSAAPMSGGYRTSFHEITVEFVAGTVFDGTCG